MEYKSKETNNPEKSLKTINSKQIYNNTPPSEYVKPGKSGFIEQIKYELDNVREPNIPTFVTTHTIYDESVINNNRDNIETTSTLKTKNKNPKKKLLKNINTMPTVKITNKNNDNGIKTNQAIQDFSDTNKKGNKKKGGNLFKGGDKAFVDLLEKLETKINEIISHPILVKIKSLKAELVRQLCRYTVIYKNKNRDSFYMTKDIMDIIMDFLFVDYTTLDVYKQIFYFYQNEMDNQTDKSTDDNFKVAENVISQQIYTHSGVMKIINTLLNKFTYSEYYPDFVETENDKKNPDFINSLLEKDTEYRKIVFGKHNEITIQIGTTMEDSGEGSGENSKKESGKEVGGMLGGNLDDFPLILASAIESMKNKSESDEEEEEEEVEEEVKVVDNRPVDERLNAALPKHRKYIYIVRFMKLVHEFRNINPEKNPPETETDNNAIHVQKMLELMIYNHIRNYSMVKKVLNLMWNDFNTEFFEILNYLIRLQNSKLISYVKINNYDNPMRLGLDMANYSHNHNNTDKQFIIDYNRRYNVFVNNPNIMSNWRLPNFKTKDNNIGKRKNDEMRTGLKTLAIQYNDDDFPYYQKIENTYYASDAVSSDVENFECIETTDVKNPNDNASNGKYQSLKKVKTYEKTYLFGRMNQIFLPHYSNEEVTENMETLVELITNPKSKKKLFTIGYGASGAGKTSSLIYLNKGPMENREGIIIHLCNRLANLGYTKATVTTKEFFSSLENEIFEKQIPENNDDQKIKRSKESYKEQKSLDENLFLYNIERGPFDFIHSPNPRTKKHEFLYTTIADSSDNIIGKVEAEYGNTQKENSSKLFGNVHSYRTSETYSKKNKQDVIEEVIRFPNPQYDEEKQQNDENMPVNLGKLLIYLIDTDRLVKATTNNPNSSRSHVLLFLKMKLDEKVANDHTSKKFDENHKFYNAKQANDLAQEVDIIIGDFAGVENKFVCNPTSISTFLSLQRDAEPKTLYYDYPKLLDGKNSKDEDFKVIDIIHGGNYTDEEKQILKENDEFAQKIYDTLSELKTNKNIFGKNESKDEQASVVADDFLYKINEFQNNDDNDNKPVINIDNNILEYLLTYDNKDSLLKIIESTDYNKIQKSLEWVGKYYKKFEKRIELYQNSTKEKFQDSKNTLRITSTEKNFKELLESNLVIDDSNVFNNFDISSLSTAFKKYVLKDKSTGMNASFIKTELGRIEPFYLDDDAQKQQIKKLETAIESEESTKKAEASLNLINANLFENLGNIEPENAPQNQQGQPINYFEKYMELFSEQNIQDITNKQTTLINNVNNNNENTKTITNIIQSNNNIIKELQNLSLNKINIQVDNPPKKLYNNNNVIGYLNDKNSISFQQLNSEIDKKFNPIDNNENNKIKEALKNLTTTKKEDISKEIQTFYDSNIAIDSKIKEKIQSLNEYNQDLTNELVNYDNTENNENLEIIEYIIANFFDFNEKKIIDIPNGISKRNKSISNIEIINNYKKLLNFSISQNKNLNEDLTIEQTTFLTVINQNELEKKYNEIPTTYSEINNSIDEAYIEVKKQFNSDLVGIQEAIINDLINNYFETMNKVLDDFYTSKSGDISTENSQGLEYYTDKLSTLTKIKTSMEKEPYNKGNKEIISNTINQTLVQKKIAIGYTGEASSERIIIEKSQRYEARYTNYLNIIDGKIQICKDKITELNAANLESEKQKYLKALNSIPNIKEYNTYVKNIEELKDDIAEKETLIDNNENFKIYFESIYKVETKNQNNAKYTSNDSLLTDDNNGIKFSFIINDKHDPNSVNKSKKSGKTIDIDKVLVNLNYEIKSKIDYIIDDYKKNTEFDHPNIANGKFKDVKNYAAYTNIVKDYNDKFYNPVIKLLTYISDELIKEKKVLETELDNNINKVENISNQTININSSLKDEEKNKIHEEMNINNQALMYYNNNYLLKQNQFDNQNNIQNSFVRQQVQKINTNTISNQQKKSKKGSNKGGYNSENEDDDDTSNYPPQEEADDKFSVIQSQKGGQGATAEAFKKRYDANIEAIKNIKTEIDKLNEYYEYGSKVCKNRTREGIFINQSLEELRNTIQEILIYNAEGSLETTPDFIEQCMKVYCPGDEECFKLNKFGAKNEEIPSILFNAIYKHYDATETINPTRKTKKEFYDELMVNIFCVFNITKSANNPPVVPYIDNNSLKRNFANKLYEKTTKYPSYKNKLILDLMNILVNIAKYPKKLSELHNSKSIQTLVDEFLGDLPQTDSNNDNNNNNKIYTKLKFPFNKHDTDSSETSEKASDLTKFQYNLIEKLLSDLKPSKKSGDKNLIFPVVIEKFKKFHINKDKIHEMIRLIDKTNAASVIGTLEFVDIMTKFGTTDNICTIQDLEFDTEPTITDNKEKFEKMQKILELHEISNSDFLEHTQTKDEKNSTNLEPVDFFQLLSDHYKYEHKMNTWEEQAEAKGGTNITSKGGKRNKTSKHRIHDRKNQTEKNM